MVLLVSAMGLAFGSDAARGPAAAMVFFGCGAAVLVGALCLVWAWLREPAATASVGLSQLGVAGLRLRPTSSFAIISCLSVGLFLVGGIGGGTLQPRPDPLDPSSGTGGFAWLIRPAVPIQDDLGTNAGLARYGLSPRIKPGQVLGLSVHEGDDASCMNLGSAQQPRLLGVDAAAFEQRGVFHFLAPGDFRWADLVNESNDPGVLPVVGDAATVYWGLHLNVGDEVTYMDAAGRPFAVRIVGIVENWIFQGALVADRDALSMRFPDNGGDGLLVVERDENSAAAGVALHRQLADHGVVLQQPTHIRGVRAVEDIYVYFGALRLGMLLAGVGGSVVGIAGYAADVASRCALGFALRDVRRAFDGNSAFDEPEQLRGLRHATLAVFLREWGDF